MVPTFLLGKQTGEDSSTAAALADNTGGGDNLPHCGRRAFIRYLDKKAGLEDIKSSLAQYGQLLEIQLALKKDKSANLGMCSVTFADSTSVDTLLQDSEHLTIKGKKVKVERFRLTNLSCTSVKWSSKSTNTNDAQCGVNKSDCGHKDQEGASCCVSLPEGQNGASGSHKESSCKISCSKSGNQKSSRIVTEYLADSRAKGDLNLDRASSGQRSSNHQGHKHKSCTEPGDCASSCQSSQDHHHHEPVHHHHDSEGNHSTCIYARHICSAEVRRGERSCSSAHQIICNGTHDSSQDKHLRSDLFKKSSKLTKREDLKLKSTTQRLPMDPTSNQPVSKKQAFMNVMGPQDTSRMRLSSVDIMNKFERETAVDLLGMMNSKPATAVEPAKTKGSISSPKPTNKDYYSNPRHHLVKINKNHTEENIRFNRA